MTKRIALLFPGGQQRGGAEALLIHYLRAIPLNERDRFLVVFLRHGPLPDLIGDLGYDVRVIEAKRLRNVLNFASIVLKLGRLFRREDVFVVLSWMSKAHLYGSLPAKVSRIPTIWYQHGISGSGGINQIVTALPAALILCCSEASALAQRKLSPKREISVVYPAADLNRLQSVDPDRKAARLRVGLDGEGSVVAMFARFERWKGIDTFIDLALAISESHENIRFVIVGGPHEFDPEYEVQVKTRVASLKLADRLLLVGQKPMDEVPFWMTAADIIVHPVTGAEPFGMVIVEAMALGRAVVASATGGIPEIIEHGVSGLLIAPNNLEELTRATDSLLTDRDLREKLGENARRRAKDFSTDRLVASLDSVISRFSV